MGKRHNTAENLPKTTKDNFTVNQNNTISKTVKTTAKEKISKHLPIEIDLLFDEGVFEIIKNLSINSSK